MARLSAFLKAYSDSSFTNPHQVALPDSPKDCTGDFTHMGAKYWGFESKRHVATSINPTGDGFTFNAERHHWFELGLTSRSKVNQLTVSTQWFTGNQVPIISALLTDKQTGNTTLALEKQTLAPDANHTFDIDPVWATDCKILCFHEGGISRVNLYGEEGEARYQQQNILVNAEISHISNAHYGRPADAVIGRREQDYMFGWESARTGFGEHALFKLAEEASVESIIVDTYLHRLNPPLSCHIYGAKLSTQALSQIENLASSDLPGWKIVLPDTTEIIPTDFRAYMTDQRYLASGFTEFEIKLHLPNNQLWKPLVSFGQLHPDTWHEFTEIEDTGVVNAIYYMHYPHGGIHGLKVFGA